LDKCDYDPAHKLHERLLEYAASDKFALRDELAIEVIQSFLNENIMDVFKYCMEKNGEITV
jgi:hypothetical protein